LEFDFIFKRLDWNDKEIEGGLIGQFEIVGEIEGVVNGLDWNDKEIEVIGGRDKIIVI
jgi:hypothetical protein